MKHRTPLTIVCLKNQKPHQPLHQRSGVILPMLSSSQLSSDTHQQSIVPSLAYLSARLQFDQHEPLQQQSRLSSDKTLQMTETRSLRMREDIQHSIEKYVEGQKQLVDNKKNTIRSMMGSIDFSLDRKKQSKIAKTIQQTVGRFNGTQRIRTSNKKPHKSILENGDLNEALRIQNKQKEKRKQRQRQRQLSQLVTRQPCSPQNRTVLAEDFNVFLSNQKRRPQSLNRPDQTDVIKLRKLAIVNPQDNISPGKECSRLDLFRFQLKDICKHRQQMFSISSNLSNSHVAMARARLQKKMFRMALHMGDRQFDWTSVPSDQGFQLSTPS